MFIDYLLSAVLMLITFAIGSSLRLCRFREYIQKIKAPIFGAFLADGLPAYLRFYYC